MSNWNLVIPMEGKNFCSDIDFIGTAGVTGSSTTIYSWNNTPITVKYRGKASNFYKSTLGAGHDAIVIADVENMVHENTKWMERNNLNDDYGIFCFSFWMYIPSSNNANNYENPADLFWSCNGTPLTNIGAVSGDTCQLVAQLPDFNLLDQWQRVYVVGLNDLPAVTAPYLSTDILTFKIESNTYSGASWDYYACGKQFEFITQAYNLYDYARPTTLMFDNILGCQVDGYFELDSFSYYTYNGFTRNDKWGGLVFNFENDLYLPVDGYQGTGLAKRDIETYTSLKAGKNANIDENSWSERTMIFKSTLVGNGTADLTTKRRRLQSLFSNLGTQILYTGDGVDKIAHADYVSGLEGNSPNGFVEENITVNFAMYDPFFYGFQKEGCALRTGDFVNGFEFYDTNRSLADDVAIFGKYGEYYLERNGAGGGTGKINQIVEDGGVIYFVGDASGGGAIGLGTINNGQYNYNNGIFAGNTELVAVQNGFACVIGKLNNVDTKYNIGFYTNEGGIDTWGNAEMGNPAHPSGTSPALPTKLTVWRNGDVMWACVYSSETTRFLNVLVVKATLDRDLLSWTLEQFPLVATASNAGTLTNGWSATKYIHDAILLPYKDKRLEKPLVAIGGQFTFTTYTPNLTWQNNVVLEPDELDSLISANHDYQYLYDTWYYSQSANDVFYRIAQMCWGKNQEIFYAEFNNNDTTFGSTNWKTRISSKYFGSDAVIVLDKLVYTSAGSSTKPISYMVVDPKNRPIIYGNFVYDYVDWFANQQDYQTRFRRALYGGNVAFTNITQIIDGTTIALHQFPATHPYRFCYAKNNGDLILAPDVTFDIISQYIETHNFDADAYKIEFNAYGCELHYIYDVMADKYFVINQNVDEADFWYYRQENGQVEIQSNNYGTIFIPTEDIIIYPKQKNSIRLNFAMYGGVEPYSVGESAFGSAIIMFVKVYAGVGY